MNNGITQRPLSYVQRLERRSTNDINRVVIHCTELPDLSMARIWGEKIHHPDTRTGNSGHFYIDRDGLVEQWVPLDRIAHHVRGYNHRSIGIELVNTGRYPNWFHSGNQQMKEPYPDRQIEALGALLKDLANHLPGLNTISGHSDLDVGLIPSEDNPHLQIRRKMDPGPLFPWSKILDDTALNRPTDEIP